MTCWQKKKRTFPKALLLHPSDWEGKGGFGGTGALQTCLGGWEAWCFSTLWKHFPTNFLSPRGNGGPSKCLCDLFRRDLLPTHPYGLCIWGGSLGLRSQELPQPKPLSGAVGTDAPELSDILAFEKRTRQNQILAPEKKKLGLQEKEAAAGWLQATSLQRPVEGLLFIFSPGTWHTGKNTWAVEGGRGRLIVVISLGDSQIPTGERGRWGNLFFLPERRKKGRQAPRRRKRLHLPGKEEQDNKRLTSLCTPATQAEGEGRVGAGSQLSEPVTCGRQLFPLTSLPDNLGSGEREEGERNTPLQEERRRRRGEEEEGKKWWRRRKRGEKTPGGRDRKEERKNLLLETHTAGRKEKRQA